MEDFEGKAPNKKRTLVSNPTFLFVFVAFLFFLNDTLAKSMHFYLRKCLLDPFTSKALFVVAGCLSMFYQAHLLFFCHLYLERFLIILHS